MPRVVHFEIPVDNPDRAVKFYSRVFDWKIEKWESPVDYWLVTTGSQTEPGINGGIMRRAGQGGVVNSIDVPSVDSFLKKIEAAGGKIVQPKTAVPGMGYVAYFQDTEGNTSGIFQSDMSAR